MSKHFLPDPNCSHLSKAVFRKDPTLDRTHTEEMEEYLMESVHGVKQWVRVSVNNLPFVKTKHVG
tara:strand:- start:113 stop:307 length:195 start_codon:yes stop_codon:yes gene_type:complete